MYSFVTTICASSNIFATENEGLHYYGREEAQGKDTFIYMIMYNFKKTIYNIKFKKYIYYF